MEIALSNYSVATLETHDNFPCPKIFPLCWIAGAKAQYAAARQADMSAGIAAAAVAAFMTNNMQSSYATQPTAQRAERSAAYGLGDPIPASVFQPSQQQIEAAYRPLPMHQSQRADAMPSYGYSVEAQQNAWRPGVTDNLGNLFNSYTTTQTDSAWQSFKPSTIQEERHSQIYKLEHSPLQQGKLQFDQSPSSIPNMLREELNKQADYFSRMHARQEDQLAKADFFPHFAEEDEYRTKKDDTFQFQPEERFDQFGAVQLKALQPYVLTRTEIARLKSQAQARADSFTRIPTSLIKIRAIERVYGLKANMDYVRLALTARLVVASYVVEGEFFAENVFGPELRAHKDSNEPPAQLTQAATMAGIVATAQRAERGKISNKTHATSKSCKPETTSEFRSSCGTDLDLMCRRARLWVFR